MSSRIIDTLVMLLADQNSGKSNQIRSIFEEFELYHVYRGYPISRKIARKHYIHPDTDLFLRLSSWHEKGESYSDVKRDIKNGWVDERRRYKVLVPAQISATSKLVGGEDLFIQLFSDFEIRRAFAVWLSPNPNPNPASSSAFAISKRLAGFMSRRRHVSALSIDSSAAHPSANPTRNSINSRLLSDLLFRV
ncbi:hypothetical protein ML401_30490 [Bradyrhizobium sp. 62B]|uniref:hypothetical protein n=1 Tax=Bradyrhizobium sp. 62B TaxID=2898442 RepID=UPI002557F6A6|nr:hypothetical protein ML401_30490 [Bradyrhizobium sp. 62B]